MKALPVNPGFDFLSGRDDTLLLPSWSGHLVHREVLAPLEQLRQAAADQGFELAIASGYRSYQRQRLIWQDKLAGRRPLLDAAEQPLDVATLSQEQAMWALLRWSAIPGASRHHWGTDVDVYDARSLRERGLSLQLTVGECQPGGPLHDFHCWLHDHLGKYPESGFFRPYAHDLGGVAPEPWHLSYHPLSSGFEQACDIDFLMRLLAEGQLPLNALLERHAREIYERYICLAGASV